jgi:hypothetical protein
LYETCPDNMRGVRLANLSSAGVLDYAFYL